MCNSRSKAHHDSEADVRSDEALPMETGEYNAELVKALDRRAVQEGSAKGATGKRARPSRVTDGPFVETKN
jgi:hypothetical protein